MHDSQKGPPVEFIPEDGDSIQILHGQTKGVWRVTEVVLPDNCEVDDETIISLSSSGGDEITLMLGDIRKGIMTDEMDVILNSEPR